MRLVHVVAWRHAIELLEDGREGGRIIESAGIHHLRDIHVTGLEEMGSLLQTDVADEVVRRLTSQLFHLTVQVDTAEAYFFGNSVDAEV